MYPRNNASPEPIAIGAVIQISDGAVQTSGVSVRIRSGGSESAGAGSIGYSTDGVVLYTPTQSETNVSSFILIASKAGCFPVAFMVVTTDASTPGRVRLDGVTHSGAVIPTVTAVTNRVTANADQWNGVSVTGMPMPTYTQPTGFLAANFGNLDAAVSSRMATFTLPLNFSLLSIDGSGRITVGTNADKTGYSLTNLTIGSGTTLASGTHQPQSGDAFARIGVNGAGLTAIGDTRMANLDATVSSRATQTSLDTIDGIVDSILVDTDSTIPTLLAAIASYVDTEMAAVKTVTDKMDTMLVLDGAVWQLTTNSLENAPAGGGGGGNPWLTDLATGYTGTQAGKMLKDIFDKAILIVAGEVQFTAMVGSAGRIQQPIMIGDDYLAANGRAFQWTIPARAGYVVGTSTCRFGGSNAELGTSWSVTGTVSDLGGGQWKLSFDMSKAVSGALLEGYYRWSVELISAGGTEITEVYSGRNVEVRAKQT